MRHFLFLLAAAASAFAILATSSALADDRTHTTLVRETMAAFADGLKRGDMSALHADAGPSLRKEHTPEQMLAAFAALAETKADLAVLDAMQPVFASEQRQGDTLDLAGFYSTSPSRAYFRFRYELADGSWKLLGISVRIVPLVKASTMRHNAGWTISLDVLEPASEIEYALPGGKFQSTGHRAQRDPATGEAIANTQISVPELPTSLRLKLITRSGPVGPLTLSFDADASVVKQDIDTLEMTRGGWAMQRTFDDRELLYFTHLVSYRCGIQKVRYSVGSELLDREYPLPPCDMKDPHAIPDDFEIVTLDRWYPFVAVQLDYKDGRRSQLVRIPHPDPQVIKPGVAFLSEHRAAVASVHALLHGIRGALPHEATLDYFGLQGKAVQVRARRVDGRSMVEALRRVAALQDPKLDGESAPAADASGLVVATARPAGAGKTASAPAFVPGEDFESVAAQMKGYVATLLARSQSAPACTTVMDQPSRAIDDEVYERVRLLMRMRCNDLDSTIRLLAELEGNSPTMFIDEVAIRDRRIADTGYFDVGFTLYGFRE